MTKQYPTEFNEPKPTDLPKPCDDSGCQGRQGEGEAWFSRYCGAWVCAYCDRHVGLARCYCGWALDGGDGRQQLVDYGENIEEDW